MIKYIIHKIKLYRKLSALESYISNQIRMYTILKSKYEELRPNMNEVDRKIRLKNIEYCKGKIEAYREVSTYVENLTRHP